MKYYERVGLEGAAAVASYCLPLWQPMFGHYVRDGVSKVSKLLSDHVPVVQELLKPDTLRIFGYDAAVKMVMIFFTPPVAQYQQPIHVDSGILDDRRSALNIPLQNCDNGWMYWYGGDYENHPRSGPGPEGGIITYLNTTWNSPPHEVASCLIDTPHFVRTDVPHHVLNLGTELRVMLSIRYFEELPFARQD